MPLQLLSAPSQTSVAPGWTSARMSLQSASPESGSVSTQSPPHAAGAGCVHADFDAAPSAAIPSPSQSTYQIFGVHGMASGVPGGLASGVPGSASAPPPTVASGLPGPVLASTSPGPT